jgi:flavin-dependent dehydrogenase
MSVVLCDCLALSCLVLPCPALYDSWVAEELKVVRNTHASFHLPGGCITGMAYSGLSCFVLRGKEPWTIANSVPDSDRTKPAAQFKEIAYPKPDGVLSFDLLTNLQRSGTHSPIFLPPSSPPFFLSRVPKHLA